MRHIVFSAYEVFPAICFMSFFWARKKINTVVFLCILEGKCNSTFVDQ